MATQTLAPTTAQQTTDPSYDIDPVHSSAEFGVRHLMIANVRGRMAITKGTIEPTHDGYHVEATLAPATIDTGTKQRDDHLRSPDFFHAEKFPEITFKGFARKDEDTVEGELTIRGLARPVTLHVEREGQGRDPWGNQRVALAAKTTIDRTQWGLNWNQLLETGGVVVGDKVKVELNIQAVERKQ